MESERYSFHRLQAGRYTIHATSDEHGVVCVGAITLGEHPLRSPWEIHIDGKLRGSAGTLKLAKRKAVSILDSPYNGEER